MSNAPATPRVGFVSLGCPKALVDSERIITQLRTDGYEISPRYEDADLVVVNTCGFIDSARDESLDAIGEAISENGKVIVTGCLGKKADLITQQHPKVLAVTGPHAYEDVLGAVHQHLPPVRRHDPFLDLVPPQGIRLTPRHYAYLKISEGCNHKCRFCIIPSLRGKLASRPVGDVMREAERLVDSGVQELMVISQDTSAYGADIRYKMDFWEGRPMKTRLLDLCQGLGQLGAWVRLHYVYPYPHVDEVIPLMAEGLILPYLDIPFQHGSERILKLMRRPAAAENTLERIRRWREICPDLTIRSTFIVGFPGETEEDFQTLLDWLTEAQIDRAGCFTYSAVDGAAANDLPDAVPEDIKQERLERFMTHQAAISEARLQRQIGKTLEVLIDHSDENGGIGRGPGDAPEVDGQVFVSAPEPLVSGQRIPVLITDSDEHDLYGRVADL